VASSGGVVIEDRVDCAADGAAQLADQPIPFSAMDRYREADARTDEMRVQEGRRAETAAAVWARDVVPARLDTQTARQP